MDVDALSPEMTIEGAGGEIHGPGDAILRNYLGVQSWITRDLQKPEPLLGDLVTKTSRTFLVGSTGLGKTMFGLALACGMAAGTGFLHWRSAQPARVLYIDGEMPADLIKARSADAVRRAGADIPRGNLFIFARDLEDEISSQFLTLGKMAPLNSPDGKDFILRLVEKLGGIDVIIFDNVMSLLAGDQREEVPWNDTLPLIEQLTKARVGQVWLDHTGHNTTRQYGSSTKAWRFDAVGIMEPVAEADQVRNELAFKLSFDAPGKARRRTPDNWREFEPCTIRLADDAWTAEHATAPDRAARSTAKEAKLRDGPAILLRELRDLIATHGEPVRPTPDHAIICSANREELRSRLIARGWFSDDLLSKENESTPKLLRNGYKVEWNALNGLKRRGFCSFTNTHVWAL